MLTEAKPEASAGVGFKGLTNVNAPAPAGVYTIAVLGRRGAISGVVETTPSSPAPPVLQRVLAEGTVHVSVNLVCSCAGTPADCSAPCGSGEAPSVFVDLVATRDYSGIVLSILQLRAENRVQIR